MTKIMRTLWDESAELTDEAMASDASVLSDSYTSGDVKENSSIPIDNEPFYREFLLNNISFSFCSIPL